MSIRAIARSVAYANKCVTLEMLRRAGTSSKDGVRQTRSSGGRRRKRRQKRPRQVGGRGTMRSNVRLSLGTGGCRNLGRLNLRQLPLPHHHPTPSPLLLLLLLLLLLPPHAIGSRRHRHRHFRHYRNARRRDTLRPTWCKRAFESRNLASRQSRQTRHTRYNARNRGAHLRARARCLHRFLGRGPFVPVTTPLCALHPDPFLPSLLSCSRTAAPHLCARDRCVAEGLRKHLWPPSSPPPFIPHPPTPLYTLQRTDTRIRESRLSFRTGSSPTAR